MITEQRCNSYSVATTNSIFTPEQCQMIIKAGRSEPKTNASVGSEESNKGGIIDTKTRTSHISWIPFKKMTEMYKTIEKIIKTTHVNQNIFDRIQITEIAQYKE